LRRAYDLTQFVSGGDVWDGIGEQEAMIALLRRGPQTDAGFLLPSVARSFPGGRKPFTAQLRNSH